MARKTRIIAAAAAGAVVLVAARPAADLLRSAPEGNIVAIPAASGIDRQTDQRFSRDELERRDLNAQAIADAAVSRSTGLTAQAAGIADNEKVLKVKAKRAAEAKRKAEAAKKAEEKRQAAAKAKAAKKAASSDSSSSDSSSSDSSDDSTPTGSPKSIAKKMMKSDYGWGSSECACYNNIIIRESNWDYTATNVSSGAYGIPQALPGSKMASAGSDWRTNPATQIEWSLGYIKDRYGTPCQAWSFKSANGWY